jgi:PAS domain S-box-containing protein
MNPTGVEEGEEPVNILVVDDRVENRVALRAILSSSRYNVVECGSGQEALRELLARDFAVLLLDVIMPIMSGFELAGLVRQRDHTASTPILFLTAEATDIDLIYRGYQIGAVDYLVKPLVPSMVQAKVAVFVELYRQRRRVERQAKQLLEGARREGEMKLLEQRLEAERRFRHLADAIPHIVFAARPEGTIDYFNERWFEYTGAAPGPAGGTPWAAALQPVLHPEDLPIAITAWERTVGRGRPLEMECRVRRALDGNHRWHLVRVLPELDAAGEVSALIGTFTDIEEQKRAQAVLAEFKGTLDAVQDAVLIFEATSWRVLHVSQGAVQMLGYATDELLRMTPAELMPDFPPETLAALVRAENGESKGGTGARGLAIETRYRHKDGQDVPVEVSFQYIAIDGGRVVAIGRDISDRKQAELERRRLYDQAVEAVGIRDEFLSIASHELRTPLASLSLSIDSLVRLLRDDGTSDPAVERTEKRLKRAARQVERLTHLVGELLDVARINRGRLDLHLEDLDLAALVRDVATRFGEDAERAGCAIVVEAPVPVMGRWDPMRLEQVVMNLLSNAMKFGAGKPIEVVVRDDGPTASLAVRDQGIGITPEFRERIFGRFERGVSGRHFGGLGLGLYIVDKIVTAHGGQIAVDSEPGAGARFTVTIPCEAPEGDSDLGTPAPEVAPTIQ